MEKKGTSLHTGPPIALLVFFNPLCTSSLLLPMLGMTVGGMILTRRGAFVVFLQVGRRCVHASL